MASSILSSTSYLHYLNDYLDIIFQSTDRFLIEHINETYFDEIETFARLILAQWQSGEFINESSALYIENVGYLNRKIALLNRIYPLNDMQIQRIEQLLFNSEMIQLLTSILQSIIESNSRHDNSFLRSFGIFLDAYSAIKKSNSIFDQLTQQAIQSKFYKQYLLEVISSTIEAKHRFFIGTLGQLAPSNSQPTLNKSYSEFLQTFYTDQHLTTHRDLHYCTLGVLSQLEVSYLIDDYPCLSTLGMIVFNETTKICRLPIFILFNSICIQSKTAACYLNTDQLIDILLEYTPTQTNSPIHMNACLLLGHLISEKQLLKLRISYKLTMKFLDLIVRSKQERNSILQSLLSLTIHESVQDVIAQTYQLKLLIELSQDYSIIHEIIWKLSFHPDILEQLILRHDDYLKELPTTDDGILENIRMKNLSRLPVTTRNSFDLCLVSSSKDQNVVQQINDNLLKNHFRLGNVSNSFYILLCISEESKHDCQCQATIRQALLDCKKILLCIVQKTYRIDNWFRKLYIQEKTPLNILELGMEKVSLEIRKDLHMNASLPTIIKKTRIVTPTEAAANVPLRPPSAVLPPVVSILVPRKRIQDWTNREVLEWCEKDNLSVFKKILTHYDGRNLLSLAHLSRLNTPHTIINQLRNDSRKLGLRLSFVDFVRFQTALDDLLRLEKDIARKQSISTLANRYVYRGKTTSQT